MLSRLKPGPGLVDEEVWATPLMAVQKMRISSKRKHRIEEIS
jgi:hypothetical protein